MRHLDAYLNLPEQARTEFRASLTPRETALLDRTLLTQLAQHEAAQGDDGHIYHPHGAAHDILNATETEVVASGPAGTGKSRACLEKIHGLMQAHPGARALIVRKTAVSLTSTALVTWNDYVTPEAVEAGTVHYFGGNSQEPASYRYANGSRVVIGGLDKATRIMSSEYDLVFVQEAIEVTPKDWQSLTTRLRNGRLPIQQIIGDTNPGPPTHWLKERCDTGRARMIYCRHTDNPTLYNPELETWTERGDAYLKILGNLTGVYRSWYLEGKWAGAEGLVYDTWNEATHLIDPIEVPDDWPRLWAVDFGYTNPFVCQHWAIDPDGRAHRYREFYQTRRLVEAHAADILAVVAPGGEWIEPKPKAIICDHDAEGRATLEKHLGLRTKAAHKAVIEGIQAVQARLADAGDGKPRLFLHRDALVAADPALLEAKLPTCTEQELLGYVWHQDLEGKANKEEPVKANDHGSDTLRYLVAHLDLAGRKAARVRFIE